jgi:hypothetical protein
MGWITKLVVLGLAGYSGYGLYDLQRGGYFDLPELPAGAYTASFKSGLRGIILDAEVSKSEIANYPAIFRRLSSANPERKYLGVPFDVAPWFEDVWSTCIAPTDEIRAAVEGNTPEQWKVQLQGARLDAFCYIEVDDQQRISRGVVYSVPRL